MAINQNHLFEELNGVKCAIVEKNVSKERADFLKHMLEYNHYTVVIVPSPPAKTVPPKPVQPGVTEAVPDPVATTAETTPATPAPPAPETFTVGVTDVTFNPINAIFGRLLKAPGGHIVTLAYWHQKEKDPHDEVPYFENENK